MVYRDVNFMCHRLHTYFELLTFLPSRPRNLRQKDPNCDLVNLGDRQNNNVVI